MDGYGRGKEEEEVEKKLNINPSDIFSFSLSVSAINQCRSEEVASLVAIVSKTCHGLE